MIEKKSISFLLMIISLGSQSLSSYIPTAYEDQLIAKVVGYRLPNNTAPRLYTLNLDPHIDDEEFTFDGTSSTVFEVLDPTRSITFHASLLIEIDKTYTTLIHNNGTIERPISQRFNSNLQFFNLRFSHTLEIGNYTVKLKWKGYNADNLRGFYRAVDMDEYGNTQYMVATHFQPLGARTAFPCWDEPGFKAEFEISLKHYSNYSAISNMPIKDQKSAEDGKIWTSFRRSPIMSTYLATFVVAHYARHDNEYGNMTFFVPSHLLKSANLVFEVSPKMVDLLEDYTGISYSLPKLDSVLIPQYSSSATEHWGLISYWRPILFDPNDGKIRQFITAMYLAGHEITHQWLGNLVTPAWWSDLWLSEAFAVYLGNKVVDGVTPGFHAMELFVAETVNQVAFTAERWYGPPRPIRWMPESPQEVRQMFSPVTYRKGAAVVRMLEHILTEEVFCNGLRNYINKHQFGSVVTDDLWESLQEVHNKDPSSPHHLDIKTIMDPWVEQTGYPILNVRRDDESGLISITQSNALNPESANLWSIPINYATSSYPYFSSTRPTHFMRRANESFVIYGINKDDWIILNIQQTGFYRVNYDWNIWKCIATYLNTENYHKIHILNRAQLLHDVFYLAQLDINYYELLVDIAAYLHRETNFLPWMVMNQVMNRFAMPLMNTPSFDVFRRFGLHLLNNIVDHIGFEDRPQIDDTLVHLARVELLPWACAFGHEGCKAIAPIKLMQILQGKMKKSLSDGNHEWIYCTALTNANETLWDLVMNAHWANPHEHHAFKYLGCAKNHTLMKKYLTSALAENATLLSDDIDDALESLSLAPAENYNFALDFFIENFDRIEQYLNARNARRGIWDFCHSFASLTKTLSQYEKLTKFLNKQSEDGKINNVNKLIDTARETMRNSEKISALFTFIIEKKPYLVNFIQK